MVVDTQDFREKDPVKVEDEAYSWKSIIDRQIEKAERDPLTGLYNRRLFQEAVKKEIAQAEREPTILAMLFIDLDSLKEINDLQGHTAGDEALKAVAEVLQKSTRAGDYTARLSGDEFGVLLVKPDEDQIIKKVDSLRILMAAKGCPCSIGWATWENGLTYNDLVGRADSAMYEAKTNGKDGAVGWQPGMKAKATAVSARKSPAKSG